MFMSVQLKCYSRHWHRQHATASGIMTSVCLWATLVFSRTHVWWSPATGFRRCQWTMTNNLTLISPALSLCCSNRTDHNIWRCAFLMIFHFWYTSASLATSESESYARSTIVQAPIDCAYDVIGATALHAAWYRTSPILSTFAACSHATAKERYVAWLILHAELYSTKILTLCCCVACRLCLCRPFDRLIFSPSPNVPNFSEMTWQHRVNWGCVRVKVLNKQRFVLSVTQCFK